jgi:hypothetical protein
MPSHYGSEQSTKSSKKLTDKQKADLKKHMDKLDLSPQEKKSHRMSIMSRMRRGSSVNKAHKDVMSKKK